jgi:hypothetical protein
MSDTIALVVPTDHDELLSRDGGVYSTRSA